MKKYNNQRYRNTIFEVKGLNIFHRDPVRDLNKRDCTFDVPNGKFSSDCPATRFLPLNIRCSDVRDIK
jgi:hypothetical protein